jgi:aminoglycoside phosphotransferase (APT) family kinase protein
MVEDIPASDHWVIPTSILRCIPGCAGGEPPLRVQMLYGGRNVNRNLRIDTRRGRFVLRQRICEGQRPGADPLREVACHCTAAAAGVAPIVLDSAPDGHWILMDYIEGGTWTPMQLQTAEGLRTLGARLQRLHAITPPKGLAAFDPVSIATGQAKVILERDPAAGAQVDALVARAQQLAVDCATFAVTPVTTHGDLNVGNLVGPVPMLVDWEYAQLADPVYDLACLSVYYPGLRPRGSELLGVAGITDANAAERLRLHTDLFDTLDRLWEKAQGHRPARADSTRCHAAPPCPTPHL